MANEENESKNIEIYKNRIIEIIEEYNDDNTKKLLEAVKESLNDRKQILDTEITKTNKGYIFLFFGVILLSFSLAICFSFYSPYIEAGKKLEPEILFGSLAFIIALASYVASVARQIIEKLSAKNNNNYIKHRKNLFYLVIAEMQIVLVGLFIIFRILFESWIFKVSAYICFSPDSFLISYLAVILLYLGFLHSRTWCHTKPWIIKTIAKD